MNNYAMQAVDFLRDTSTIMTIKESIFQTPPIWHKTGIHGVKYDVTLKNKKGEYKFDFWGSIHDREQMKKPTYYGVLACLDVYDGSLDDFVADFGYDNEKVTEVIKTYESVIDQSINLKRLFTEKQIRQLQEII
jgi:hypothetical protein